MSDKIQSINTPVSFEKIKYESDEFIKNIITHDYIHIITEFIIKEFRDYYTPNIPYKLYTCDETLFIKNGTFKIDFSDSTPKYVTVEIQLPGNRGEIQEIISFREFMYVYCNPEGLLLLEKIGFIINNIDFEQEEEKRCKKLGVPNSYTEMDYDDDIPF